MKTEKLTEKLKNKSSQIKSHFFLPKMQKYKEWNIMAYIGFVVQFLYNDMQACS